MLVMGRRPGCLLGLLNNLSVLPFHIWWWKPCACNTVCMCLMRWQTTSLFFRQLRVIQCSFYRMWVHVPLTITMSLMKNKTKDQLRFSNKYLHNSWFQMYMCNLVIQWHNRFFCFIIIFFVSARKWKSNNHCSSDVQKFNFSINLKI